MTTAATEQIPRIASGHNSRLIGELGMGGK
jgi:hypothetical protein